MPMASKYVSLLLLFFILINSDINAATVPVHDPSIVVVYKDVNGNSFPTNDAGATRTKYYFVFGTMLGAAYSNDMINWTAFTPSFSLNGSVSTNYYNIFKTEADYAVHSTTADVLGNLWAPDVIYNTALKKWCMYFSLSGVDFKSSIILLTSDKVEGPYVKVGDVVFGGFTNSTTSIALTDYAKVTGSSTIDARYLTNGAWNNDYSVSCIDPCVLYDQNGKLWMSYGSWSGGIFLLKLDESTGLRSYTFNYGLGINPVWNGTRLHYDPYMGIHIGGGYYVSGEGSYIEYIKDANGVGFYYMFVSMGFYSPDGGYTMRVFRSATIDGAYTDVTGDNAVFAQYIFNYGNNVQYGFPIMQNYKWSWWATGNGEIAQGHNSVLQDDDGNVYLIYHRKFDNVTAWHNVEVHQLFVNEKGWIVAAPFEYIKNYGLTKKNYTTEDIVGLYGVITHNPVDYANLATNQETSLYVNADGTLTGSYTGTWTYNYSNGRQYLTLTTTAGTFQCVLSQQLMNGLSSQTLAFSGMNAANERALWGYRYAKTATTNTNVYTNQAKMIGKPDYSLVWNSYSDFCNVAVTGDFEVEYTFLNNTQAVENWQNWAIALTGNGQTWHMRADAYSISTFTGSTVNYKYNWDWANFKEVYKNKDVRVKIARIGTSINVFAQVGDSLVFTATAINCPTSDLTIYLGGEACFLDVKKVSVSKLLVRQLVGTVNDDGSYTSGFNVSQGATTAVSGDFELKYLYFNYHNSTSKDIWDNFIVRAISGTQTMLLRADAFASNITGTVTYATDWDWAKFISVMSGAYIDLTISRLGNTITYSFVIKAKDGNTYNYKVVNSNALTTAMTFGFTCEESMVDLLEVETTTYQVPEVKTQTIALKKGWNLISTNIVPVDSTIATLFSGLDVQEIKTMDAFWRKGQNAIFNKLTTINTGNGYLVNMNVAGNVTINGLSLTNVVYPQTIKTGWQLIGCPFQTNTALSSYFNTTNCASIKNFDGFWIPGGTTNSISNLDLGKGYFLKGK